MIALAVAGLTAGGAYGIIAIGLTFTYRLLGVLNFALAAFGAFGTYTSLVLYGKGVSYPLAFLVGVVTAAGVAGVVGFVMTRWFYDATTQVRSSVAIALLIAILAIGFRIFGRLPRSVPGPFGGWNFTVGGVSLAGSTVVLLVASVLLAGGMTLVLGRTAIGVRLRAISQLPLTAELLGVPARRLVLGAWVVIGAVVGVAVLFVAPTITSDYQSLSLLVIPALAGALLGGLTNVWVALTGGVLLGVAGSLVTRLGSASTYGQVVPLIVIAAAVAWQNRRERWDAIR